MRQSNQSSRARARRSRLPSWSRQLRVLIRRNNAQHHIKPKGVSNKTMHERERFLWCLFRNLIQRRGKPLDPYQLGNRHLAPIIKEWGERGLAASTIQTYLSFLRAFSSWIGKDGLVREAAWYGLPPEQVTRSYVARADKTWTGHGVNIDAKIEEIGKTDAYVGAQLSLAVAFALRRKEANMLRPHGAIVVAAQVPHDYRRAGHFERAEHYLFVGPGTKGGRVRYVPIDAPQKWAAVERAKALVAGAHDYLGRPGHSLKSNLRHFNYVVAKHGVTRRALGVTTHGLRHQYANDAYEASAGAPSPVRGGPGIASATDTPVRLDIAGDLGHGRKAVVSQYIGARQKESVEGESCRR